MDITAKYLVAQIPILLVLWGRYTFHTILTFLIYTGKTRSFDFLKTKRPGLQFIRASALFCATICIYTALKTMPIGDAAAIQFLAPVLVTVISGLFLGEHVGPKRWIGVITAFLGVLLVARPGFGGWGWTALWPLMSAVLLSIYMSLTRIIRTKDHPDATTFYSTAVGAVVLSAAVPFSWQPLSTVQWELMVVMGTAGAVGHYLLIKAFHMAEASLLAPFFYFHVVAAIFWGFLVFGDVPSLWTFLGTTIIIGSGVYVWYREVRHLKI